MLVIMKVLSLCSMNLRKWRCSDPVLDDVWKDEDCKENSISVLGIKWNPTTDQLSIKKSNKVIPPILTKRIFVSIAPSFYDPLGFTSPCFVRCKLFIQKLFTLKLSWDENLL